MPAYPFNSPHVSVPEPTVRVDVEPATENPRFRLNPGEQLTPEKLAELMQGAEVYTKEVG